MKMNFLLLNQQIINCTRCPRLASYIRHVAQVKVKRHRNETYWGRPVPGIGDQKAEVLVLGLAPAAHGATRTGRMFTGDASGDWLMRALHQTGFSNQPESINLTDGLTLYNIFISSSLRCAPPENQPLKSEILNCRTYFMNEEELLRGIKVVITLGKIAFDNYCQMHRLKLKFGHLNCYRIGENKTLISSFHPSKQNTQTGKLLWMDWLKVFQTAHDLLNRRND